MSPDLYPRLLDLACGAFLIAAVLVLWFRELSTIVRVFALQGVALALIGILLGVHGRDPQLVAAAAGVGALRAGLLPYLLRRAVLPGGRPDRTRPMVNATASLLSAAALTLVAYAAARPLVRLAPSAATQALPVGLAVVLIGFLVLVTRRRAAAQVVGFLLLDNGITAVAFLATSGVPLIVELGVSFDLLLAVVVLQLLTTRMQAAFGGTDLDELRELHD